MLFKLLFVAFMLSFVTISRSEEEEIKEGSGHETDDNDDDVHQGFDMADRETEEEASGENVPQKGILDKLRHPPSAGVEEKDPDGGHAVEEEDEMRNGGGGIIIDEGNDDDIEKSGLVHKEPVPVKENSLITHPGILAAIIVGGVLVLVCLVIFFVLLICCVRRKDEGRYDLDKAMKQKLKYVTYTKEGATDMEFFA